MDIGLPEPLVLTLVLLLPATFGYLLSALIWTAPIEAGAPRQDRSLALLEAFLRAFQPSGAFQSLPGLEDEVGILSRKDMPKTLLH